MHRFFTAAAAFVATFALSAQPLRESVTWDNIKAHPAPLPVIGEVQTRPSVLDAPSLWSVGMETMDRDYAVFDNFSQYIGQTGVGYGRLQSGWAKTEQKKGKYDFAWLDAHVDGMIERGIRPWVCLCYGNPLYSPHGHDLNAKLFADGPVMDAWLRYVKATVKHYKGRVRLWEVWNEPDGRKNLDSYALYANLFVRTAKVIKEVDPEARVAAFGSCSPDREYIRLAMKEIEQAGGVPYMDCLTYHAYWPIPETIIPAVKQLRSDMDQYNPSIQLIQGETGCPAQLEYGHALKNLEWTEYSQAKWDLRQAMVHFSMGIPYSFFTMVDLRPDPYEWKQKTCLSEAKISCGTARYQHLYARVVRHRRGQGIRLRQQRVLLHRNPKGRKEHRMPALALRRTSFRFPRKDASGCPYQRCRNHGPGVCRPCFRLCSQPDL